METLKILTWNLGYGAMGADADISLEGGKRFIPSPSKAIVKNIAGFKKFIAETKADVYLLQELSNGSLLNRWHNVRKAVREALPNHHQSSISNFALPLFFDFLRNEHGMGTFVDECFSVLKRRVQLFNAGEYYYRIVPRWDYALTMLAERKGGKPIVMVNTHLSSFDQKGAIRISQFLELIAYVRRLNKKGFPVVVGADWNLHEGEVTFCGEDESHYKKYVHGFPHHLLPKGWRAYFPTNAPTLRAGNRPFVNGESTTFTVDGFICSPEIQVKDVIAHDLGFAHSDHNPVEITISY